MAICAAIGFSTAGNLMAQKDTVQLEPVTVSGFASERFMSGLKVQRIDSTTISTYQFQNIGDLLSFNTAMALKNYGPGQLTTASFRGTSASHTAVLWNGLNINSPTLGQTDFSTIPVAAFDRIAVQYGSAGSTVGTDAVGGSILLGSGVVENGFFAMVGHQQESFKNGQTQVSLRYGRKRKSGPRFSGKTSLYDGRMLNDYPYSVRNGYHVLSSESFQKGIVQDVYLTLPNKGELSLHAWLTNNTLTTTPEILGGRERTTTRAYRSMLRYQWHDWVVRSSWTRDVLVYGTGDYANEDHAVTDRFSGRAERTFQRNFGESVHVNLLTGAEGSWYHTQVAGYYKPSITESRGDLFFLSRVQVGGRWLLSANVRQAFVARYSPPLTPSLGVEYALVKRPTGSLKMKGSVARSYRVPTLNERYWKNLGNPDIKPESGFGKELGMEGYLRLNSQHTFTASLTAYHNRVKNWTYWNPARNYRVENLQQVLTQGLEVEGGWRYNANRASAGVNVSYNLTKSVQEKGYDSYSAEIVGKQLAYVPRHSANFNAFVGVNQSRLLCQIMGAGNRYNTSDNSTFLKGYALVNVILEHLVPYKRMTFRVQGRVNNLTNTFYLNVMNNAMPGRSYAVSLMVSYKQT
jgi:vitamin B12 transporter